MYHQESHFAVLSSLRHGPKQVIKRTVDIVGALVILVLVSPIMIAAAIAVRFSGAGPIIFVQQRYGHHRRRFPMFKFRTMVADAEERQSELEVCNEAQGPVFKLKADPRITHVGAFLRRTSIDELPQLFNVLLGEMSLVGPRPLPLCDVSHFEEVWLLRRFSIRPGLTCLWQISGRSETGFDDWIKQDLTYIDTWSLTLDLKILAMTVPAVLRGKGAM
jgi:lipopolysaccharide/colanic/teichoic acid biosynthesis glycosyltransferase